MIHASNARGGGNYKPIKYNNRTYDIYPPQSLCELEFDALALGVMSDHQISQIQRQLAELGIVESKNPQDSRLVAQTSKNIEIITYFGAAAKFGRLNFIKTLQLMQESNGLKEGCVAELGVWRGESARYINSYFPQSEFYLLDTFEGFSTQDLQKEKELGHATHASTSDFSDTSLEFVKRHLPNLQKCHFIKGYFPQSTIQMPQNLVFRFVNIDVDLYQPILAGLEYFYPRMLAGGVILVHDYFHPYYTGTKQAVDEFCARFNVRAIGIGDGFSVMIQR
ncbi:TylF/MycF/NovP-related O-methyltransferase [uncultured Helicobacter sp.]|uniref:TylF/MycF/NovP-related O-methyltransferase n=1 Tax=uncultured Helicobacter sp. TaxID=175537 RepID=UPI00374EFCAA